MMWRIFNWLFGWEYARVYYGECYYTVRVFQSWQGEYFCKVFSETTWLTAEPAPREGFFKRKKAFGDWKPLTSGNSFAPVRHKAEG